MLVFPLIFQISFSSHLDTVGKLMALMTSFQRSNGISRPSRCVCNIDCSHISFNPVCASDGRSYDNPCQVKEASCQKQERIEVKYLGHCQGQTHRKHTHTHTHPGADTYTLRVWQVFTWSWSEATEAYRGACELNADSTTRRLPPAAAPATFHDYSYFHSIIFWNSAQR